MKTEQKIYLIRKMLGWSQEALGERLGMSQRHYGRLEKGETPIKVETLEAICREWGITYQQFVNTDVEHLSDLLIKPSAADEPTVGP